MICAGCRRELEVGDHYIIGTTAEMMHGRGAETKDAFVEGLVAEILGGGQTGQIIYCEDCTVDGGEFLPETYWGDDDA